MDSSIRSWRRHLALTLLSVLVGAACRSPLHRAACSQEQSDEQLFPRGVLDERRTELDRDAFRRAWFSKHLRAMDEPSLSCGDAVPEQVRFLWLRTFHRPVAVRVARTARGSHLRATVLSGHGGYDPGRIEHRIERDLTPAEENAYASALTAAQIWSVPPRSPAMGRDGAEWIFEARRGADYRVVIRWTPRNGPLRDLGLELLRLAQLDPAVIDPVY